MIQLFYRLIYASEVNYILRNINRILSPVLPAFLKISPSGTLSFSVDGKTLKLHTNQTNYLSHMAFWYGYQNFEYTKIFMELVKHVNSFYDIGANIGYYSIMAAHVNPNMEVHSFEPASGPLAYLRKNIEINGLKNVHIESIALSDKSGKIDFFEMKNNKYRFLKHNLGGEGNTGTKTIEKKYQKITVDTMTLDEFNAKHGYGKVDLMKLDTEGTENFILENGTRVLNESKPIVICETLFGEIEDKLDNIMKSHGYYFFNHTENGLERVDSISRTVDNGVRNCFFVHPDKLGLIDPFVVKNN